MHYRYHDLISKQLQAMKKVMEALPDIEQACRYVMDLVFEMLPAARVAIMVNDRRATREPLDFVAEVFGERRVAGPVRFTPKAEAIESVYSHGKLYVSPDSPHIVCAPVIVSDRVRGAVYFESTRAAPDFIVEQTKCIQASAIMVASIITRSEEISHFENERIFLYEKLRRTYKMVGDGPAMRALQRGMRNAATGDGPVLILGESGTGKEVIAFGIHDMSSRAGRAFILLQCGDTDKTRLRKALLGDRASWDDPRGTVFLKEISRLALPAQKALLQIVQHEKPHVRLMASTQLDLDEEIARHAFLPGLAEHLTGYTLLAPALRERIEDIPFLVNHFVEKHRHGYKVTGISPEAMDAILLCSWSPLNVRALDLGIEAAIMSRRSGIIRPEDLPELMTESPSAERQTMDNRQRLTARTVGRKTILRRLEENGGDADDAALSLGVLPEVVQAVLSENN